MLSCKAKKLRCGVIIGTGIVFLLALLTVVVSLSFIIKGNSCSPEISTNVTVTPCNYEELKGTQLQATSMVHLPNDYLLKVVVRRGTPSLCVFHRSSTNTTFTLQLVTSVEDSPLCSPEKMPSADCLPSSHVSFNGIEHFGVSVWDQQSSSVHYLIVNISSWITFHKNLTNTIFKLQDLWYNALNCKEQGYTSTLVTVMFVSVAVIMTVLMAVISYCFCKMSYKLLRERRYKMWGMHVHTTITCFDKLNAWLCTVCWHSLYLYTVLYFLTAMAAECTCCLQTMPQMLSRMKVLYIYCILRYWHVPCCTYMHDCSIFSHIQSECLAFHVCCKSERGEGLKLVILWRRKCLRILWIGYNSQRFSPQTFYYCQAHGSQSANIKVYNCSC